MTDDTVEAWRLESLQHDLDKARNEIDECYDLLGQRDPMRPLPFYVKQLVERNVGECAIMGLVRTMPLRERVSAIEGMVAELECDETKEQTESRERRELARLRAKYEGPGQ